jgi:hypothetical protein
MDATRRTAMKPHLYPPYPHGRHPTEDLWVLLYSEELIRAERQQPQVERRKLESAYAARDREREQAKDRARAPEVRDLQLAFDAQMVGMWVHRQGGSSWCEVELEVIHLYS